VKEKAYKLLAQQENISNREAKELIDTGNVFVANRKVHIARAEMDPKTRFIIRKTVVEVLFEDRFIIAVNKPSGVVSETLEKRFNAKLLHRLDKGTSGVLILVRDEEFREKAIEAFRQGKVYKAYLAVVEGLVTEEQTIDVPISTVKDKKAKSRVDLQGGKAAKTFITPESIARKRTKLNVIIETGRTHQIRTHLNHIGFPILGDVEYGGRDYERIMLHAKRIKLFNYDITAPEPTIFKHLFS